LRSWLTVVVRPSATMARGAATSFALLGLSVMTVLYGALRHDDVFHVEHLLTFLLALVFALSAWSRMLDALLRLGFFHGLLGFGGTLGAGFAAFLALFVENLFAA